MKKTIIALSILTLLSGCASTQRFGKTEQAPEVTGQMTQVKKEFNTIPAPASGKPVSVAVYSFQDKTGQRRPVAGIASLSTAVTQGAETFLIQALQNVGQGQWFDVVERVGIDNLTKERTIIRQMREAYEGPGAKPLMPMQFAGMIIEGGIIGYDSSTKSGGVGARWLGIGASTQYSEDIVTVSLRAVSVQTGKVLLSVTVQKTILSSADSVTALKFFDAGTKAFEGELGMTINEPGTYAVKSATEAAVVELIKEGERKGVWSFKEKANVLVPSQAPQAPAGAPVAPTPVDKSSKSESDAGSEKQVAKEEVKTEAHLKPVVATVGLVAPAPKKEVVAPLAPSEVAVAETVMYTNGRVAYLWKTADDSSPKLYWIAPGTEMTVEPFNEEWFVGTTRDGRTGYVKKAALVSTKPVISK
jgi:curli production assembly/transport component CsgG